MRDALRWLGLTLVPFVLDAQGVITTRVGTTWVFPADGRPAVQAPFGSLGGVAIDAQGNMLVADEDNCLVFRIDTAGITRILAGTGVCGMQADGVARERTLWYPSDVAVGPGGLIYILESGRILRVSPDGQMVTVAGGGTLTLTQAAGGPATRARMAALDGGLAVDRAGNLYFTDYFAHRVARVAPDGTLTLIAGNGTEGFSGDGGPALQAQLAAPTGVAVDAAGNILIADNLNRRIRRVTPAGIITTVAGGGTGTTDGIPATAFNLGQVTRVGVDAQNNFYVLGYQSYARRVAPDGTIRTVAGSGRFEFSGDGGPATQAGLIFVRGMAQDAAGNLYFCDLGNARIRRVTSAGIISTVAGNGQYRVAPPNTRPESLWLTGPEGLAIGPRGDLWIADRGNNVVRVVAPDGTTSLFPQAPSCPYCGPWIEPKDLTFDTAGNLYVLGQSSRLQRITPNRVITDILFANCGYSGDGGPARQATACSEGGVAVDAQGNIFLADTNNHRIRRIDPLGFITTIAGTGVSGFSGDGGPAMQAQLSSPKRLVLDSDGSVVFGDGFRRVRRIRNGSISTIAGGGNNGLDGIPAVQANVTSIDGLLFDRAGNLYIADAYRVRRVGRDGLISTVAGPTITPGVGGTLSTGFAGDGGPPLQARFNFLSGLAIDAANNLYIADKGNNRVRVVLAAAATFTVSPATLSFGQIKVGAAAPELTLSLAGSIPNLAFTVTVATTSGGNWLAASPQSGAVPGQVRLTANITGLAPGAYQGTVRITVPGTAPGSVTVPVSLTVQAGDPPKLTLESQRISFAFSTGAGPSSAQLTLRNTGGAPLNFTASASAATGNWLTATPAQASLGPGESQAVTITATPGSLAAGTYPGEVAIASATTGERIVSPVAMTITRQTRTILLSQTGMTFTAVAGAANPLPQDLAILNIGQGAMNWTAGAATFKGGNWLALSTAAGLVATPFTDFSHVAIAVNAAGLSPGDYFGQIQVNAEGADNGPQSISVALTVLPAGSDPGPEIRPTGLVFSALQSSAPGAQTVVISNSTAQNANYSSGRLTLDGAAWLEHEPSTAAVPPGQPVRVLVQPNFTNLAPGVRRGVITLLFNDASNSIRNIAVLSVVAPPASGASKDGARAAGACSQLLLQPTSLRAGFNVAARRAQPIEVRALDDCGVAITAGSFSVGFSNGDPGLKLNHTGNGLWTGTWQPRAAGAAQVRLSITGFATRGATNLANQVDITGNVGAGAAIPSVVPGAVVNAASYEGRFIAPGGYVSIFGDQLATGSGQAQSLPLPNRLSDAEVIIGGRSLPLNFASNGQINAQIPYDLPLNTEHQIVVRRGDTISVPEVVTVASAQPAIYTQDQSGRGPGVIVKANNSVVTPANPVRSGEVIVIYCNGLGAVNPPVAAGRPAPLAGPLSNTVNPVTLSIGGRPATVSFAGLTPGIPGLYQINAVVPAGLPASDTTEVRITVAGQQSVPVTIAVR